MFKRICLTIAMVLVVLVAQAQYAIGIKGGYNTSFGFNNEWKMSDASNIIYDAANGFNVGVMARFGYRAYAQIEALYVRQISERNITIAGVSTGLHEKVIHQAISLPVLFGISVINNPNFKWHFNVGPVFDFNIDKGFIVDDKIHADPKAISVGLDCGTGVDISIVTIDLRYKLMQQTHNYRDLIARDNLTTSPINAFEIAVGIRFLDRTMR